MDEPRRSDALVAAARTAAHTVGEDRFLELLRWHRSLVGLPELDWGSGGTFRQGVTELGEERGWQLVRDLRHVARDPKAARHGLDGKPTFRDGRRLADRHHPRN